MKGFVGWLSAAVLVAFTAPGFCAEAMPTQAPDPQILFYERLNQHKGEFAQFRYLTSDDVQSDPAVRDAASQMLATSYSFMGRPNDALRSFSDREAKIVVTDLPDQARYEPAPAADWITTEATKYRVVMINEAHHSAETRILTFSLLTRLRTLGYTHFAVEALSEGDVGLAKRGYPVESTGYYTREPIFADMIREALRLGYELVPYESPFSPGETQQQRETIQATNLVERVLAKHPDAKMLVHAGYAHISKTRTGLPDDAKPMAMEFMRLTGLSILSVDQTAPRPYIIGNGETEHDRLNAEFEIQTPSVLLQKKSRRVWSMDPERFDATVILPKSPENELRPAWLSVEGKRIATSVDMSACLRHLPCLVEARYAAEGDDAIPADQFVMIKAGEAGTPLFLPPGKYRIRLLGNGGNVISSRSLDVSPPQAADPAKVSKIVPQSTTSTR